MSVRVFLVRGFALGFLIGWGGAGAVCAGGERVLWDGGEGGASARVTASDATFVREGGGWVVGTGTNQNWPGVTIRVSEGDRDLSAHAFVGVTLRNPGDRSVKVFGRVDNPGADGTRHCVTGEATLAPGATRTLRLELKRHRGGPGAVGALFGMRGYPVAPAGEEDFVPTRVNQVLLFVTGADRGARFEISRVVATGDYVRPTAAWTDADPYLPFIDAYGQYRHRDWPGKIRSAADLEERRVRERDAMAKETGPSEWTKYGGWAAGPQLEGTGFFRVQKWEGRWWFVDPEGRLFWSHGVDCVRMLDYTPVEGREGWFADLPAGQSAFREFEATRLFVLKGHYAGGRPRSFTFAGANLLRKYGEDWRTASADVIHRRLRSWGMNTIGNWSDGSVTRLRRTPYTDALNTGQVRMIEGSEGYWGKYPDVFDPGFREQARREMAGKRGGSAGDPWCLGYFSDNEMSWGDETSLAEAALRSPAGQPAKRALRDALGSRYAGIGDLNEKWGTKYESWEGLLAAREVPDRGRARADLTAFYSAVADRYFCTIREIIREVAPSQVYLGCRFAWVNPLAAAAAARHCDVVSYNLYQRSIRDFVFNGGADVPLIVGEFHFGALDRGMFHPGLVPVSNQEERARAYREYVEGAIRHPQFVGTHWFQWQDEPTTGRVWDEENYQIGLVDIADTPHPETVAAVREVGRGMYRLRSDSAGR